MKWTVSASGILAAILGMFLLAAVMSGGTARGQPEPTPSPTPPPDVPFVIIGSPDYPAGEIALIYGSGFEAGDSLDVLVTRPDGSVVTGDGNETSGWDVVTAGTDGSFTYWYQTPVGLNGSYVVSVSDAADTGHGNVLATTAFTVHDPPLSPYVTTNKLAYAPGETAVIMGTGMQPLAEVDVVVVRPDGSVVTGDGSETPGWDSVTADALGTFSYNYHIVWAGPGEWAVYGYDSTDIGHVEPLGEASFVTQESPSAPTLRTDKPDYQPGETASIVGSGFEPGASYDIPVFRPDGTMVKGDGSGIPGWDSVTADSLRGFIYRYQLDGIEGFYTVEVYPSPWGGVGSGRVPLATARFSDAYWNDENAMKNDTSKRRLGFIYDPGVGRVMNRSELVALGGLLTSPSRRPAPWSYNFLWYSQEGTIDFPHGDGRIWSACNWTWNDPFPRPSGPVCPEAKILEVYDPSYQVWNAFYRWPVRLWVFKHTDHAFIAMVCANYSWARANPVPRISGYKFLDGNWNGIHDAGEAGLGGWTIILQVPDGRQFSAVTDGGGFYRFFLDALPPGVYTLTEIEQSGWVRSTPPARTVFVNYGVGDYEFGGNDFGNYQLPTLTVEKTVVNDDGGTATAGNFQARIDGNPVPWGVPQTLSAGSHTAGEDVVPGYTASAWSGDCNPDGTITLLPGDNKTCTITNNDVTAHLKLCKVVVNDNGGTMTEANWTLGAAGPTPLSGPGPCVEADVNAGTYNLSESPAPNTAGYASAGYDCGASVSLALGESKTCTITNNDVTAHLKLCKVVVNDNGGTMTEANWTLGAAGPTPLAGPGPCVEADVNAGTYNLSESPAPNTAGYASTGYDCGASVTLALGESKTCTITNDDIPPKLHLRKVIVNDNGGEATVADFTLTADGTGSNDLSGTSPVDSGSGLLADTWALSETSPAGYTASDWVCVGGTQSVSNIAVGIGGEATCTITNDDIPPKLTVEKIVINDDGGRAVAGDFQAYVDGGPVPWGTPQTLVAGPHTASEDVIPGYTASAWGGGCAPDGSVTLTVGEDKTCYITNDDVRPFTGVVKDARPDQPGTQDLASLWLCKTGPDCFVRAWPNGPFIGKGELKIAEMIYLPPDEDSPNDSDSDPEGLAAYEFQVKYDHKVFDPVVSDAGADGLDNDADTMVDEADESVIRGPRGNINCTFTILTENDIRFGCVSAGQNLGNPRPSGLWLATINVQPDADMFFRIRPTKDNGVVSTLLDENCEVADIYASEPWPGTLAGGLTPNCEDVTITVRMLEGDLNLDCQVNALDEQLIAQRYGSFFGLVLYDAFYDLEPKLTDFDIDIKDVQFVFGRDGSDCQSPLPNQPPIQPPP